MAELSYRRHRFPPVVIQHAVWALFALHAKLPGRRGWISFRPNKIGYATPCGWPLSTYARWLRYHGFDKGDDRWVLRSPSAAPMTMHLIRAEEGPKRGSQPVERVAAE